MAKLQYSMIEKKTILFKLCLKIVESFCEIILNSSDRVQEIFLLHCCFQNQINLQSIFKRTSFGLRFDSSSKLPNLKIPFDGFIPKNRLCVRYVFGKEKFNNQNVFIQIGILSSKINLQSRLVSKSKRDF